MVKARGPIPALRRFAQRLLPKSRLRTFLNSLLLIIENRRARIYEIADMRVRFLPDAAPSEEHARSSEQERLGALQLAFFARTVQPGHLVADVGAYRGEYTVVAAMRCAHAGHVVAFEPTGENIDWIDRNCRVNHVRAVVDIVAKAVSDAAGMLRFYSAGTSSTNSLISGATQGDNVDERVIEAVTLDEHFRETRWPDVLKIDVEGGEWRVLRGAEQIVHSNASIICELHPYAWPNAGDDPDAMRAWLAERGRSIIDLVSGETITEWRYGPVLLRKTTS